MTSLSGGQAPPGLSFYSAEIAGQGSQSTLSSSVTSINAFLPRATLVFVAAQ